MSLLEESILGIVHNYYARLFHKKNCGDLFNFLKSNRRP
jgi:hypothetical protein